MRQETSNILYECIAEWKSFSRKQVAKLNISYARIAKKIDMKLLKTTMWKVLTKPTDEDKVHSPLLFPFLLSAFAIKNTYSCTLALPRDFSLIIDTSIAKSTRHFPEILL